MAQIRVRGYVVGYDVRQGAVEWTVRMNEDRHPDNGKKFDVGSFHPGTLGIKAGVNVTFVLGEKNGSLYNMALDVRLESNDHPRCFYCDQDADVLFRFLTLRDGASFRPACLAHYIDVGNDVQGELDDMHEKERKPEVKNLWREDDTYRAW